MLREFDFVFIMLYVITISLLIVADIITTFKVKRKFSSKKSKVLLENLIVVIPFRNEAKHLPILVNALNQQRKLPKKIIFVNDHSEDEGVSIIEDYLDIEAYEILHLEDGLFGKKKALRKGIYSMKAEFYLTMDADVYFAEDYFENLEEIPSADMVVLPVLMKGRNFIGTLYSLDQLFINAISYSFSFRSPITASGANLMFRREAFVLHDLPEMHYHVASGDDQFLLRDFKLADKEILQIADKKFRVCTYSPRTFKKFIDQRLRWAGKNSEVASLADNFVGFIAILHSVSFYILCIAELLIGNYEWALYVFGTKVILDLVYYSLYFSKIGTSFLTYLGIVIVQFLYTPYAIALILLVPFYKPKWKGREIYMEKS